MASLNVVSFTFLSQSILVILLVGLSRFIYRGYRARRQFYKWRAQGLPMPPWNMFLGHLPLMVKLGMTLPKDLNHGLLMDAVRRMHPELGKCFYLDVWPLEVLFVVYSPDLIEQLFNDDVVPKHPNVERFTSQVSGGRDLLSMRGAEWKLWRNAFNPGFSPNSMMSMVPGILEEMELWRSIIERHAKEGIPFALEPTTVNLTLDVIGRALLGTRFQCQIKEHVVTSSLRQTLQYVAGGFIQDFLKWLNPLRPLIKYYWMHSADGFLQDQVALRQLDLASGKKCIIDYVLDNLLSQKAKQNKGSNADAKPGKLSKSMEDILIRQIRFLIFAGHDTTSTTISQSLYLLSKHPKALAMLREEHDAVFGTSVGEAASMIRSDPHLLNKLPYSLAVIKETLRLFPPASSARGSDGSVVVEDRELGMTYPTSEGIVIYESHYSLQRNPRHWPEADRFEPERWLGPLGNESESGGNPLRGTAALSAWRPFEVGPRACIGLNLSYIEARIALVMTAREFDFTAAFGELDEQRRLAGDKSAKDHFGEEAYLIGSGVGHPRDGMWVKVSQRK